MSTPITDPTSLSELPADDRDPLLDVSVGARLREQARLRPDATALAWDAGSPELRRLTYRELLVLAESHAAVIAAQTSPGDRVAVWAANSIHWVLLECASALAGTVLTPFNTAWVDDEVAHALRLTTPRLVYVGLDGRGGHLAERATRLSMEIADSEVVDLLEVSVDPSAATAPTGPLPEVQSTDPFLIQFTSGTTGRAKGAVLSHRAALNAGWLRARTVGSDESDVWVNPVPLHHIAGSCIILLAALSSGATYVVMSRFLPEVMVDLMRRGGATRIGGVPTMVYAVLDHPEAKDALREVRSVGLGGTSVPPSLVETLQQEYDAPASVAYAQSECPMITSTLPDAAPALIATTVGVPTPHMELRIVGEDGSVVPRGEVGEVRVRSVLTMDGYFAMPEATAEAFDADGFLRTGDLGTVDADGVVRIHGRAREVIIRGGENVYPIEVEDALLRHPSVEDVAVVAVPSARWGEEVGAVVRLAAAAEPDVVALEEHAATALAHFKVPRHWRFVEEFPLTASGKIRKVELSELFEGAAT